MSGPETQPGEREHSVTPDLDTFISDREISQRDSALQALLR